MTKINKSVLIPGHFTQEAWVLVPDLAWVGYKAQSATDFLEHGMHFFTADQLVQWARLMWGIWNARNKRIFENICLEPDEVFKRSKDLCTDFSTSKLQLRLSIPSPVSECVWKKPDIGWLKLNCDASFNVDADSGCGFIIRDLCGSVELLGSCGIGVVPNAAYTEAIGIREGIQCAVNRGMNRLVVE